MRHIYSGIGTTLNSSGRRGVILRALTAALLAAIAPQASAQIFADRSPERIQFTIDVAEDMAKFVEPRVPVGTEPLRGSFFVTEGNIYKEGTIPKVGGDQFDPNLPGALGTWFCKGTFLVAGSQFDKASMAVLSDQVYLLPNDNRSIATTGTEGNGTVVRSIIGGTGPYAGYTGEQKQEFLGFNKSGGVNLRVTITLRKSTNFR
jgi:hypothetical protein